MIHVLGAHWQVIEVSRTTFQNVLRTMPGSALAVSDTRVDAGFMFALAARLLLKACAPCTTRACAVLCFVVQDTFSKLLRVGK